MIKYDKSTLDQGCAVRQFLKIIGLPKKAIDQIKVSNANTSLSKKAAFFLNEFNRLLSEHETRDYLYKRNNLSIIVKYLSKIPGEKYLLPRKHVHIILDQCKDDLEYLRSTFNIDFTINLDDYPENSTLDADLTLSNHEVKYLLKKFITTV